PYKGSFYDVETGKESIHTGYHQSGHVWQAEEVLKDGKWQRYYGFVGSHRVARVTAAEIEFPDDDWYERRPRWVRLSSGVDGHLEGPATSTPVDDEGDPRLVVSAPLTFGLFLRNASGLDQPLPSLSKTVRLRVWYSQEIISRQGMLVPAAV